MPNILWITVDSMRTYESSNDDRGKIAFFDEFCNNALEFKNCYCSAPSTVMSVSSMMTAVPAVYHSTTYDHFDKNSLDFETFPSWLTKKNYQTQAIVFFPEGRQHLTHLMGDTVKQYWPKGKDHLFWSNEDIYNVFDAALNNIRSNENNFLYVHFNLRHDPDTDAWVRKSYDTFKQRLSDTIIVLTSDHGYPDPERGLKQKEMIYHGHDLLLTDDNVRVPLAIEGLQFHNKGANNTDLASLVDIAPTLQKVIEPDLKHTLNDYFKDSGIDLFSKKRNSTEVYNRYIFQKNQQIKFIFEDVKVILSKGKFQKEINFKLIDYVPNFAENKFILEKLKFINNHFNKFINMKLSNFPEGSKLFCSAPPEKLIDFFKLPNKYNISIYTNFADIAGTSQIYIIKTSDNIFKTLDDVKYVKKNTEKGTKIQILSLNFELINIESNKLAAALNLLKTKFFPRFISNPTHAVKELIIVMKKLWLKH